MLLILVNSSGIVPETLQTSILKGNKLLLCMSLAAMGLETDLNHLWQLGTKPIYLAALSWFFLAGVSLSMIAISYSSF